jgi:hypothetical protein
MLIHPAGENPHAYVNNAAGERVGGNGSVLPAEAVAAHLPINLKDQSSAME